MPIFKILQEPRPGLGVTGVVKMVVRLQSSSVGLLMWWGAITNWVCSLLWNTTPWQAPHLIKSEELGSWLYQERPICMCSSACSCMLEQSPALWQAALAIWLLNHSFEVTKMCSQNSANSQITPSKSPSKQVKVTEPAFLCLWACDGPLVWSAVRTRRLRTCPSQPPAEMGPPGLWELAGKIESELRLGRKGLQEESSPEAATAPPDTILHCFQAHFSQAVLDNLREC